MHKPFNPDDLEKLDNPIWKLYCHMAQMAPAELLAKHGKFLPALFEMCDASLGLGLFPKKNAVSISAKVLESKELPPLRDRNKVVECEQLTETTKGDTPPPYTGLSQQNDPLEAESKKIIEIENPIENESQVLNNEKSNSQT